MDNIKKKDMAARALGAAAATPGIDERFAHARALAGSSPVMHHDAVGGTMAARRPEPSSSTRSTNTGDDRELELIEVELDLIDPNPFNARKVYRVGRISELAASIGENGQDTPGTATRRNGRYVLVAGHYRYKALKMLANRRMLLWIRPDLSDRQMYEMSFRENEQRDDQTALDNALAWRELLQKKIYDSESELAVATGYSAPNINKTMAVLRLPDSVIEVIQEEPSKFKFSVVYELVLFSEAVQRDGLPQTLALARGVAAGEVTRTAIKEARERVEKPPSKRKSKETARTYRINQEGKDIGALKTWGSGKVTLEVIITDTTARHKLIAELQQRFGLME